MTVDNRGDGSGREGFMSRWARLKQSAETPELPLAEKASPGQAAGDAQKIEIGAGERLPDKSAEGPRPETVLADSNPPATLPTLDSLTPQSDFSPFMARDVDPHLRNLAMKKLFTDPHYNVMDRLDIYIDDYSVHAPLSLEVIRQMNISKTLRLFDDVEEVDPASAAAPQRLAPSPLKTAVQTPTSAIEAPPVPPAEETEASEVSRRSPI